MFIEEGKLVSNIIGTNCESFFKIHENKRLQILVKITNTGKLLIQYRHLNRTLML